MQIQNVLGSTLPGAQRTIQDPTFQTLAANGTQSKAESFGQLLPGQLTALPAEIPAGMSSEETNGIGQVSDPQSPVASDQLREAFRDFVGQTFFTELIKSYRSTQQPAAYFNGGQAEKIFQGQLDQVLSEALSKSSAEKIADPMFELFMMDRAG